MAQLDVGPKEAHEATDIANLDMAALAKAEIAGAGGHDTRSDDCETMDGNKAKNCMCEDTGQGTPNIPIKVCKEKPVNGCRGTCVCKPDFAGEMCESALSA